MLVKLLTEHHLECLSLKGGCAGSPESTLVKMPHCWKSRVTAHILTASSDSSRYSYQLDQSALRVVGGIFHFFFSNFNRTFCKSKALKL